jgi:hypothetical protein
MRLATRRSHAMTRAIPRSVTAVALALVLLPLASLAGPDGRRLTLGANRAYHDPAPGPALPFDQAATTALPLSPTQIYRAPEQLLPVQPRIDPSPPLAGVEAPPVRVVSPDLPAATPAITADSSVSAVPVRLDEARHTPARAVPARAEKVAYEPSRKTKVTVKTSPEQKHVRVTAPSAKVAVRDHKVRVDAPYTRVAVDDGRVRVRAPFVNLDIRW